MATTTNFTCNKDARVAVTGSTEMGSGTSDGLPYGTYSGYKYRTFLGFSINMAGWTSITSAVLHFKSSNQIHIAFGSDPTFIIHRIQAAWSEGSSSGLSTGNAVIYPGPSSSGTNAVIVDAPTTENTWDTADITAMMRDVLGGAPFYGLRIIGTDNSGSETGSASNVGEIYSRESGSGTAYITITYETNRAPDAPTIASPDVANGGLVGTQTPTLNVTMTDPDGNAINNYHWQIDDNSDFSSPIQDVTVGSGGANGFTAAVVPAALARGGTYYFRAQSADVSVWGGWSGTFSFKVASLPTLTVSEPSASGRLARIQYDAGSGWGSPRMLANWATTCPDGGSQGSWRVEVFNDNGSGGIGTSLNDSLTVNDTTSARIVPANLIEGNYYHVRVSSTCSHGLASTPVTYRVRARWGVVTHRYDMGVAPGSLALTILDATDGAQGKVVVEYMTTTGAAPTTWASGIGGAGLNQFFYYRTWLLIWGTSPAVSPTLNQLKITYSTAIITPDKWTLQDAANASGDSGTYVFGTQSLRMKGKGSVHSAYQSIPVVPNTNYILSARIQTQGNPIAQVTFSTGGTTGGTGNTTPYQVADIPFEDPRSRLSSTIWNSGANTSIYVRCVVQGAVGTTAWFDAIKVEASTVVTPWSPGYIADAVVLDAGGMQIDASNGGIFRLKGSAGTARDIVELGSKGLKFGGDTELSSPAANTLLVGSDAAAAGSFLSIAGGASGSEGGELNLNGSGALDDWNIDNYAGTLRIHGAGAARVVVKGTVPHVTLQGEVVIASHTTVQGVLNASTVPNRFGGTSFPGAYAVGDLWFRTDLGMWFYWDGARWLSAQLFVMEFGDALGNLAASNNDFIRRGWPPMEGMSDIWVENFGVAGFIVNTGATALSASHRWDVSMRMYNVPGTNTSIATYSINSGASGAWRTGGHNPVNALFNMPTVQPVMITISATKVGTPGNLYAYPSMSWRYVAV